MGSPEGRAYSNKMEAASARSSPPRPSTERGMASSVEIPHRSSSLAAAAPITPTADKHAEPPPAGTAAQATNGSPEADGANGWDSSVGKAGLGKTGRVINRLVSDNDGLKRDLKIERLRAEESKQAQRLLEDKMERMVSEYESRLLEANVTKTLLARKERQVETLQATIELERKRALDAGERERVWKDEMERTRAEAKRQVEEAQNYAALMEGRYNALSGHWRERGDEVRRTVARVRGEVDALSAERRRDDERINTLRDLCDQQDGNIRDLRGQREDIERRFEEYKAEQEAGLRGIKDRAREREEEQERRLAEAKEVLDKLRWALNVKKNVKGAE